MKGTPAIYLGRIVEKSNFRAFIYGANGEKKLVNSWDEFEVSMESGLWFATPEDSVVKEVEAPKPIAKPKPKPKAKSSMDDMVFEVKDGN